MYTSKFKPILSATVIRNYFGLKYIKFNLIFPLFGIFGWHSVRKIPIAIIPLVLLIVWGAILLPFFPSMESSVRLIQFFLIIGGFKFMLQRFTKKDFLLIANMILGMSLVLNFTQSFITDGQSVRKVFWGFDYVFTRYSGINGEANYTAFLLFGLSLFYFYEKKYFGAVLAIMASMLTFSRMFYIGVILYLVSMLIGAFNLKVQRFISFCSLFLIIALPFISYSFKYAAHNKQNLAFLDYSTVKSIEENMEATSSGRSRAYSRYVSLFFKYPLGVGYYNAMRKSKTLKSTLGISQRTSRLQEHSIYLQIITSFGVVGILLFAFFLIRIMSLLKTSSGIASFFSLCFCCAFINGTHEFIFYFLTAYLIQRETPYLLREISFKT